MVDNMDNFNTLPPLDLSHHYADITRHRQPSAIKDFYKYFAIPGIGSLAGGSCCRIFRQTHSLIFMSRSSMSKVLPV